MTDALVPTIVAIGEVIDRPGDLADAREPVALMADDWRLLMRKAGRSLLARIALIDVVVRMK